MKLTWMLNLTSGPDVGEAEVGTVGEAAVRLETVYREAIRDWTPEHQAGLRQLTRAMEAEAPLSLAEKGRWTFQVPAIYVRLQA